MRFPIETSRLRFVVVATGEPLRRYEEGKPREAWALRTDDDGEVLWRLPLVALGDQAGDVLRVAVPGDPRVAEGETVTVEGLIAQTWKLDGRTGVSLRARAITATSDRPAAKSD
jgi:hypothetical protein